MPKVVHLSNEIVRKLDQIRRRRRASYSEAIQWLLDRSDLIPDFQKAAKMLADKFPGVPVKGKFEIVDGMGHIVRDPLKVE